MHGNSIWDRLKSALGEHNTRAGDGRDGEQKVRVAAAVLLLEVERADLDISAAERAAIRAQLQGKFKLSDTDLDMVLDLAQERSKNSVSLHPYLLILNRNLSAPQKLSMMEMLWRVAYADGKLNKYEEALLRELADLLLIPHHDFIRIKLQITGEG